MEPAMNCRPAETPGRYGRPADESPDTPDFGRVNGLRGVPTCHASPTLARTPVDCECAAQYAIGASLGRASHQKKRLTLRTSAVSGLSAAAQEAARDSRRVSRRARISKPHLSKRPRADSTEDLDGVCATASQPSVGHDKAKKGLMLRLSALSSITPDSPLSCKRPWDDNSDDSGSVRHTSSVNSEENVGTALLAITRRYADEIVRHTWFDAAIGLIIIINMVCIAMEQEAMLEHDEAPWLQAAEHAFLGVYILELVLRFFAGGCAVLHDNWVRFDLVIVTVCAVTQWFLVNLHFEEMRLVVVMRLARLARLARAARLIVQFRELWVLVNGLIASAGIMFYTCALIFLMLFGFSLLGVELIAIRHDPEETVDPAVAKVVSENFSGLWITMLTLTQFVTMDSIATIYKPLIRNDPPLAAYFTLVFLAIGILLMNLITAVCVNEAMEQAQQNKEAKKVHDLRQKRRALGELRELFGRIDYDDSGTIDLEGLLASPAEDMAVMRSFIKEANIQEVFDILDIDGDGALDVDEFCEGLWQTMTTPTPLDFKRIDKRVESVRDQIQDMRAMQHELLSRFDEMSQQFSMLMNHIPRTCCQIDTRVVDFKSSCASADSSILADDVLRDLRNITVELNQQLAALAAQDDLRACHRDTPTSADQVACGRGVQTPMELVELSSEWPVPEEWESMKRVRPTALPVCGDASSEAQLYARVTTTRTPLETGTALNCVGQRANC